MKVELRLDVDGGLCSKLALAGAEGTSKVEGCVDRQKTVYPGAGQRDP